MVGTYGGRMQTAYSSSKFGINGLTKSCAKELGPYGIRVNAVAPGVVATDMMKHSVDEQMLAGLNRMTPLGRAACPDELAGAYVYLASDAASFTTGTLIHVDGGIVM
jgi:NAD(P)-dependent dehydrogenase (short-subunit alcohol dehydrogenase family)